MAAVGEKQMAVDSGLQRQARAQRRCVRPDSARSRSRHGRQQIGRDATYFVRVEAVTLAQWGRNQDLRNWITIRIEVRYSNGVLKRATVAADVAAAAHAYFSRLFSPVAPDIALVVANEADWPGRKSPYGLPFFTDEAGEIRPGAVVMPAGGGTSGSGSRRTTTTRHPADMRSCARHTRTAPVALTFSRSSTSSRFMSGATRSRRWGICGSRRSGSARSSSTSDARSAIGARPQLTRRFRRPGHLHRCWEPRKSGLTGRPQRPRDQYPFSLVDSYWPRMRLTRNGMVTTR